MKAFKKGDTVRITEKGDSFRGSIGVVINNTERTLLVEVESASYGSKKKYSRWYYPNGLVLYEEHTFERGDQVEVALSGDYNDGCIGSIINISLPYIRVKFSPRDGDDGQDEKWYQTCELKPINTEDTDTKPLVDEINSKPEVTCDYVVCRTKNEAIAFLSELSNLGYTWVGGERFTFNDKWERYKSNTRYCIENQKKVTFSGQPHMGECSPWRAFGSTTISKRIIKNILELDQFDKDNSGSDAYRINRSNSLNFKIKSNKNEKSSKNTTELRSGSWTSSVPKLPGTDISNGQGDRAGGSGLEGCRVESSIGSSDFSDKIRSGQVRQTISDGKTRCSL